jgi:hypothetical protein
MARNNAQEEAPDSMGSFLLVLETALKLVGLSSSVRNEMLTIGRSVTNPLASWIEFRFNL